MDEKNELGLIKRKKKKKEKKKQAKNLLVDGLRKLWGLLSEK